MENGIRYRLEDHQRRLENLERFEVGVMVNRLENLEKRVDAMYKAAVSLTIAIVLATIGGHA